MHTLLGSGNTSTNPIFIDEALSRYNHPHVLSIMLYILLLRYEVTFEHLRKVLGIKLPMEA